MNGTPGSALLNPMSRNTNTTQTEPLVRQEHQPGNTGTEPLGLSDFKPNTLSCLGFTDPQLLDTGMKFFGTQRPPLTKNPGSSEPRFRNPHPETPHPAKLGNRGPGTPDSVVPGSGIQGTALPRHQHPHYSEPLRLIESITKYNPVHTLVSKFIAPLAKSAKH